jgi:alpha-1,2-mannosyltransferase
VLLASAAVWIAALQPWHWYMGDLVVYRTGGSALLHHRSLYTVVGGRDHLHFTYPPFAAVVVAPLAAVPLAVAKLLLSVLSAGCLFVCVRVVIRRLGDGARSTALGWVPLALAVAIWLEPVRATIDFGQINLLLMALVVVDVLVISNERRSGFLVGIAAAVKLTPLAFVPYLFLIGRRRAALNAVGAFIASGLIGEAADPSASRTYWGHHLFLQAHRVGRVENASNQSVRGILARLLRTTQVPAWWVVVAFLVFVAGTAAAVFVDRRTSPVWALTIMAITTLLVSPISWSHHWVWCAVMLPVCVDLVRRRRSWQAGLVAVVVMVPFASGLVFWAPHTGHQELQDSGPEQLLSATYVLAGVILAVALTVTARSSPRQNGADRVKPRPPGGGVTQAAR